MMEPPGAVEGRRLKTVPTTSSKSGHHESMYIPSESLSKENLQLRTIFDRLETMSLDHHPQPSENLQASSSLNSKINSRCSCGNLQSSSLQGHRYGNGTGPATSAKPSDSDSDTDDEDDDESFSLVALIRMLVAEERRGPARQNHGAIKNLAASCHGDGISESHLHQLVRLSSSSNQPVRQAAFLALRQAATVEANGKILLEMGIIHQLLNLLQDKMEASNHAVAAAVMEKIVVHRKLADHWLEKMITKGLAILIGCLSSPDQGTETKAAIGRLLSNLACFFEIAVLLLDHCMEDVMEMWLRYPFMKESLTDLISNLVQHTDHTVAGVLEHRALEHMSRALREEDCSVQIKAAGFFVALVSSNYGLSALIEEGKATVILRVLRVTNCRRVRELCMVSLTSVLHRATQGQLRDLTNQTESTFTSTKNLNDQGMKITNDEPSHLGTRKKESSARTQRGTKILISILIETIHTEAKITLDQNKKVKTIGFRPGVDHFKTLLSSVRCLCCIATVTVGRQRSRTSSRNTKVSGEGSSSKLGRLNTANVKMMLHQGALCVLDLLGTYTHHLNPLAGERDSLQEQRNLDILHLQAMMKVWQMVSQPKQDQPLPGKEELELVRHLVECVQLFARCCSSETMNSNVEKEVKTKIEEHRSWSEEHHLSGSAPTKHYQYVKTVDQAFPSQFKIENITSHRQKEMEIRERRANSIQQRRVAWGDKKDPDPKGESPMHNQSPNESGDSPKTTIPRRDRPQSAKKNPIKFDLSKSVFTETAKPSSSAKPRQPPRDKLNVRTAGYERKIAHPKQDRQVESGKLDEERELHRKLRSRLFEAGVCQTVGPWVACQAPEIQTLAAECLRCIIQPLHPLETKQLRESAEAQERQNRHKSRSEMAQTLAERDKILSQVLGQMSTNSAKVVRGALGVEGQTDGTSATKTTKVPKLKTKLPLSSANQRPTCNLDKPIGWQCSIHLLETCGNQVCQGLRSGNEKTRRASLMLLHDMVAFGETVVHMKLASLGLVSHLMEFLRRKDQSQDTALIGVMTLRHLISDYRLKQIFCSEGGEAFVTDLIKTSEGALRMVLHQFLRDITEGPGGIL